MKRILLDAMSPEDQPSSLTHLLCPSAAFNIRTTFESLSLQCSFFSYHLLWHTLITYGPTYLNSASSIKCLCTLLREKLFLWGICYSLLGRYGFEDGSCLSTTWASGTCLKTAARWIKTPEGSQWGSLFRGKIGPNRITSKCIFRMKILTSALPRACAHKRSALPTDTLSPGLLMAQGTRAPPG